MKAFLNSIFVYFLLVSFALAQAPGTPIPLAKGDKAPADGIFLFTIDAARLLGNLQSVDEKCSVVIEATVEKAKAPLDLKLKLCSDRQVFDKELSTVKLIAKDGYIQQLEKRVADPGASRSWVLISGLAMGVLLTIGAGIAMNAAAAN